MFPNRVILAWLAFASATLLFAPPCAAKGAPDAAVAKVKSRYKTIKTDNVHTFLLLDTRLGVVRQCQFDAGGGATEDCWAVHANPSAYAAWKKGIPYPIPGRFQLMATENMFTFILTDRMTGTIYAVQWSMEDEKRFVRLIWDAIPDRPE